MMSLPRYLFFTVFVLVLLTSVVDDVTAQCSMCRATVENNVKESSSSDRKIGAGLNSGILYLMSIPYILASIIAFMWFKESRKNRNKELQIKSILRKKFFGNN